MTSEGHKETSQDVGNTLLLDPGGGDLALKSIQSHLFAVVVLSALYIRHTSIKGGKKGRSHDTVHRTACVEVVMGGFGAAWDCPLRATGKQRCSSKNSIGHIRECPAQNTSRTGSRL